MLQQPFNPSQAYRTVQVRSDVKSRRMWSGGVALAERVARRASVSLLCLVATAAVAQNGYVSRGVCYGDPGEAAAAECSSYPHKAEDGAGGIVVWSCQGFDIAHFGGGYMLILDGESTDGEFSQVASVPVSFADCDPLQAQSDVIGIWGAGVAAVAAVWAIKRFVYRLVANQ